jgi:hypothetical protein
VLDLVSKGFLSDKVFAAKLETTLTLKEIDLDRYDAVHVAGGQGATYDLYPNQDVAKALEHFWARARWSGLSATARSLSGTIPIGSAAAGRPGSRLRETRGWSVS